MIEPHGNIVICGAQVRNVTKNRFCIIFDTGVSDWIHECIKTDTFAPNLCIRLDTWCIKADTCVSDRKRSDTAVSALIATNGSPSYLSGVSFVRSSVRSSENV